MGEHETIFRESGSQFRLKSILNIFHLFESRECPETFRLTWVQRHMRERKVYFFLRFGGYWHISSQKGGFLPLCWWKCALFLWNGGFWALARRVFPLFWKTFSGFMVMILKSFNTWFFCSWTIKLNQTTNFIKISCLISHWKISFYFHCC